MTYANHSLKIELPNTVFGIGEVIAAAVRSTGAHAVELMPAATGDGWEIRAWVEADRPAVAAANWAGIVEGILDDAGHIWRPAADRRNPRVTVAAVRRWVNGTPRAPGIEEAAAGLAKWRAVYRLP